MTKSACLIITLLHALITLSSATIAKVPLNNASKPLYTAEMGIHRPKFQYKERMHLQGNPDYTATLAGCSALGLLLLLSNSRAFLRLCKISDFAHFWSFVLCVRVCCVCVQISMRV